MIRLSHQRKPVRLALSAITLAVLSQLAQAQGQGGSVFNEQFLDIGGEQSRADLSLFAFGNRVMPGSYLVDVSLNESGVGQSQVVFADQGEGKNAQACITRAMLEGWGVKVEVFPVLMAAGDQCVDLAQAIPGSSVSYDGEKLRLTLSIPQAAMKRQARGAISPDKWDKGINVAMLDYQFSAARYDGGNNAGSTMNSSITEFNANPSATTQARNTLYAGLRGGFNLGDWRFRNFSTYNRGVDGEGHWQSVTSYLQRDIAALGGQLTIGDSTTPGNFFDAFQFRGVQLASDDGMLPDSQQGYAPTIRGVAQTNARVTVRQNGFVVYSTYVAPGPFVLDDLYPTSTSGDLEVTITEADGRETKFRQAFSAVPTLLREGVWRYSVTGGQYRNGYSSNITTGSGNAKPNFVQGTVARGLGNEYSVYGGMIASDIYQSVLFGAGKNLRDFGAISADLSQAHTKGPFNQSYDGQSLRFLYAKSFENYGTSVRMAGYRYSTGGFRTFQEAAQMQDLQNGQTLNNRRNQVRLELAQQLGSKGGTAYASIQQQSYWGTDQKDRLMQVGYSNFYKQFSYSIFYNYSTNLNGPSNRQLMATLSIPLGDTRSYARYTVAKGNNGELTQQASVYGSALEDGRLTYNVTAAHSNQSDNSGSASASYLSQYGRVDFGRAQGSGYGQTTLGMAGGLVVHGGGVTLSQPLGETMALVEAPDAANVGFEVYPGVRTDSRGNAVLANLSPYRVNRLAVRTEDLGDNVEVKNAALDVVPTRGAVVLARFETSIGLRIMLNLSDKNGKPLPFGAKVDNEQGQELGIVGSEGQTYITGAKESGVLNIKWGQGAAEQCSVKYHVPAEKNPAPIRELNGQCE
ncbi:fimbria/pilus outer membrane usher protein [Collimonas pratensis]|uniref:Type VII secretion system (T7SS), usher family protein n=1 Tax=Collimonas pratensis TaxID=279113 RepID=A0A127Q3P4_9BURK|nr:fimbria/pilus outer membrane usher protein [Collimonas pratensis]AMP04435.1 type VII secretion system (T7SS), usher family protein [Collimonas pratensis]AMP15571.1 type VII secretion system (T7SS), usher family protein [Collimonas pratensis]NKI69904.1 fimbria/pilus outer membrane usher protein [Collimonas pratensis]